MPYAEEAENAAQKEHPIKNPKDTNPSSGEMHALKFIVSRNLRRKAKLKAELKMNVALYVHAWVAVFMCSGRYKHTSIYCPCGLLFLAPHMVPHPPVTLMRVIQHGVRFSKRASKNDNAILFLLGNCMCTVTIHLASASSGKVRKITVQPGTCVNDATNVKTVT